MSLLQLVESQKGAPPISGSGEKGAPSVGSGGGKGKGKNAPSSGGKGAPSAGEGGGKAVKGANGKGGVAAARNVAKNNGLVNIHWRPAKRPKKRNRTLR